MSIRLKLDRLGSVTGVDEDNFHKLVEFGHSHNIPESQATVGIRYVPGESFEDALEGFQSVADWLLFLRTADRRFAVAGFAAPIIGEAVCQVELIEAAKLEESPITGLNQTHVVRRHPARVANFARQRGLLVTRRGTKGQFTYTSLSTPSGKSHIKVRDHHAHELMIDGITAITN